MLQFTNRDVVFAAKTAASALLALWLALWIDLPRPYWAVTSVFIVSQPLAGATRSKASYRVYGTILGAVAALVLVPNLVDVPEALAVALALWVGGCLYFSLLDRTPRSYVLMLAGFTAAFVGFPEVGDPGSIFDFAVSRVEEIVLGILCASLIGSFVFPESAAPAVEARLRHWFAEASEWIAEVFDRRPDPASQTKRLHLACGAIAFDALVTPLRYEMTGHENSATAMAMLRQHMLMLLPITSSISDRLAALDRLNALPAAVSNVLPRLRVPLEWDPDPGDAALRADIEKLAPNLGSEPRWSEMLLTSLVARLLDFVDLRADLAYLRENVVHGTAVKRSMSFRYTAAVRMIRHNDPLLAFLSALAAFLSILLASGFWIASSWPDGTLAPMMAAVGCSFFAAQDDPVLQIFDLAKSALIGIVAACTYLFVVLPKATTFEMLALALLPALLASGLAMTKPRISLLGMGSAVFGFTLLAVQSTYAAEFGSFANSATAILVGLWTAAFVTSLVRSVGADWTARRLRWANRRELVDAVDATRSQDGLALAALMLDRVGLLAARLSALPPEDAEWTAELLAEVRVGMDVVELKRLVGNISPAELGELAKLMRMLEKHFRTDALHPPPEVLAEIDASLELFGNDMDFVCRNAAILGLTDLRRSLFPAAPPFEYAKKSSAPEGVAA
jgi:uncharacterized membrane protein YccC